MSSTVIKRFLNLFYISIVTVTVAFLAYNIFNIVTVLHSPSSVTKNIHPYLAGIVESILIISFTSISFAFFHHFVLSPLSKISTDIKDTKYKLESQAKELFDKNWELEEANSLGLMDSDNSTFSTKAFSGTFYNSSNINEYKAFHLDDDIISKTFNGDHVLKHTSVNSSPILGKMNSKKTEDEKLKELMFIPFKVKNKKIGVLSVGSRKPIKSSDESLLTYIGNNAAVAFDNALMYEKSKTYFIKTIDTLIATVEAKDSYTEGHSRRVSKYAVEIANKLCLSKEQIEDIKIAGILHDIGKIGISDTILLKSSSLSTDEYSVVKQHPLISNKTQTSHIKNVL